MSTGFVSAQTPVSVRRVGPVTSAIWEYVLLAITGGVLDQMSVTATMDGKELIALLESAIPHVCMALRSGLTFVNVMRAGLGGLVTCLIVLMGVEMAIVRTARLVNVCQDGIRPVTFRHVTLSIQV